MRNKFKVSQMAAKPISVELKHSEEQFNVSETGGTGVFVQVVGPHSKIFQAAKEAFDASEQEREDNIRLFSSCVTGWDKEDFDVEYSVEAAFNLFNEPENYWMTESISPVIRDSSNFFRVS